MKKRKIIIGTTALVVAALLICGTVIYNWKETKNISREVASDSDEWDKISQLLEKII